jgi:hypothetical protein
MSTNMMPPSFEVRQGRTADRPPLWHRGVALSAAHRRSVGVLRVGDNPKSTSRDARLARMAFGQQSGPPAASNKVRELLGLLQDAGHTDFRDARGPMGFTQRQAGGKFTREEADAFIEQLEEAAHDESPRTAPAHAIRPSAAERALRDVSTELLAAELQHRGWIVIEP